MWHDAIVQATTGGLAMSDRNGSESLTALAAEVDHDLRELQTPLQMRLVMIDDRLAAIADEREQLETLRRRVTATLLRIDPSTPAPGKPGRKPRGTNSSGGYRPGAAAASVDFHQKKQAKKIDTLRRWLIDHKDVDPILVDHITASGLHRLVTDEAPELGIGAITCRQALDVLRDSGDLVVTGSGTAGALNYGLTILQGRVKA